MKKPINIFLLALGVSIALFSSSCKREGCIDPEAMNFNPKAEKDDGSCTYAPDSGTVTVDFKMVEGSNVIQMDQFITDPAGRDYVIEMLKMYVSNVVVTDNSGKEYEVMEVDLLDFDGGKRSFSFTLPEGKYTGLEFGIGLNESQNGTDPSSYSDDHPMSITENTYWNWASKYRFVMLEGRVDTSGNQEYIGFSYHTGFDKNYRVKEAGQFQYEITGGETFYHTFQIDVEKIFFNPSDTIDYTDPAQTQSHSDTPLGVRVTDNFYEAVTDG